METKYKDTHNDNFDTAVAFLECRAREAGLTDFELDKVFTYVETQVTDVDGYPIETVLFDHIPSHRTIGVEVDKGEAVSVWVSNQYGEWVDDGTDADDVRRDPKAWFVKTLLPKKYTATATVHFSFEVECEAYDIEEANELLEQTAYDTYQSADVNGVDATVDCITAEK
jgi:hypothetical protein